MSIFRQIGTRVINQLFFSHPPEASIAENMQQDLGIVKRVVASITFVNGVTNQLQAANNTFTGIFAVGDVIVVEGTNLNNGICTVLAIDSVNGAFLTVDGGRKNEGPITATIRVL